MAGVPPLGGFGADAQTAYAQYLAQRETQADAERDAQTAAERQSTAEETGSGEISLSSREDMSRSEAANAILAQWKDMGIDTSDPQVQYMAYDDITQDAYKSGDRRLWNLQSSTVQEAYGGQVVSAYSQAVLQYGFNTLEEPEVQPTAQGALFARRKGVSPEELATFSPASGMVKSGAPFQVQPETGGIRYENGVIADPETGMIFYPPGKKVPGSYVWLDKTVGTWDATKVAEWKSKLVELGYLPKDAKVDANSETFQTALRNYWTSYYMHRGQATTLDEFSGGYSPGSDSFTSAAVLRGSIDANVTETYRGLYGIDPPQIELDTWRDRIVKIANQLQHRQDLDLGTAVNEATSRSVQKLESTPGAQFVTGNVEENTRLRDMIVRSVQVAQGMTS